MNTYTKQERNLRAVGQLAAYEYLQGRKPKSEPITLLKVPSQHRRSTLFRLFSRWGDMTVPLRNVEL